MYFTSQQRLDDGVTLERDFILGDIPGILWTPVSASAPLPLILLGHSAGLPTMYPRLLTRAQHAVSAGLAAATIELPGGGERQRIDALEQARADLRRALQAGKPVTDQIVDRLVLPLTAESVAEWQAALDCLLELPEIGGPVGYSGGLISVGTRLAVVEARQVEIPLHVLLQWDDEGNDRQMALDLFDAFGSKQKTLQANMGGHTGVPQFAGEEAGRFFSRHLK